MKSSENRLVYSSEVGRITDTGKNKINNSKYQKNIALPPDGTVRLRRETKGRGGGTVIVISGIPLHGGDLKEFAGFLKKRCGCGGTVKGDIIEIQGDHRDLLLQELQAKGYKVKLSGG